MESLVKILKILNEKIIPLTTLHSGFLEKRQEKIAKNEISDADLDLFVQSFHKLNPQFRELQAKLNEVVVYSTYMQNNLNRLLEK